MVVVRSGGGNCAGSGTNGMQFSFGHDVLPASGGGQEIKDLLQMLVSRRTSGLG